MRKILSLLLCCSIFLMLFAGCNNTSAVKSVEYTGLKKSNSSVENILAENSQYILKLDENTAGVILENKESQIQWGTSPISSGEVQYDELGMPIKRHPQVESVLKVDYIDSENGEEQSVLSYTGSASIGDVNYIKTEKGVKVQFYFDSIKVMIPVEYILLENGVNISIDAKEIEESENKITKISIAPFMCSAENSSDNSYFLYPSGSGAIIEPKEVSQTGLAYSSAVYGEDAAIGASDSISVTEKLSLPVYAVKNGDEALFSVIDSASESAIIETSVGSTSIGYSSVYASFQVRGYFNHVADVFQWSKIHRKVYGEKINTVMSVSFYPLSKEKANYSGMAEFYRDMLIKENGMSDKSEEKLLNLTLIGGTLVNRSFLGIPYQKLYVTTSLNDAYGIIEDVVKNTNGEFTVKLKGFGESGVDIVKLGGGFNIGSELGSAKEFNNLSQLCQNSDIDLYTEFELAKFSKSSNGFNTYFDCATNSGKKKVYGYTYDVALRSQKDETRYSFLSRDKIDDSVDELIKKIKKLKIDGIDIASLANTAYSDYSNKTSAEYYAKSNMFRDVENAIAVIKETDRKVSVSSANLYAAVKADLIADVPSSSDKAEIFSYDIPFYQMVFKGCIPMVSRSINSAENEEINILKAIESGVGLNYTVTANWDNNLIDAEYPLFFSSLFENISDEIYKTVESVSDYYTNISGVKIKTHSILDSGLRETIYANGVRVYVNYSDKEIVSPLGTVAPRSYLVGD